MPDQDSNHDLLVQTATTLHIMNSRLFGGDGQVGALPYLLDQHKELAAKIDKNKDELLDKIDDKKKETDADIKAVKEKCDNIDGKVNWAAGGLATAGSIATLLMGWIGLHFKK